MDDRTAQGSTFLDEEIDFDTILEEDDVVEGGGRGLLKTRAKAGYKPKRLGRTTPNWSRIATALFVAAVVLFMLAFMVKSVLDARKTGAYESYFTTVSEISTQSDAQGKELTNLLSQPSGGDRAQLIARLEKLSQRAKTSLNDARELQPPDAMTATNEWFLTSLEYRVNGLNALQKALTAALRAKDQQAAALAVAGANTRLVASDIVYADSFAVPSRRILSREGVNEEGETAVRVPDSKFVTDPEFSSPKAMKLMLERLSAGTVATTKDGKVVAPKDGKIHGGQLMQVTVSPSGQSLTSTSTTEIAGSDDLAFEVSFENQGEVQETQIPVTITLKGENSEPQELHAVIESVDPGQVASVQVPLEEIPTFGETLTATVEVGPVPGEKKTENNSATYPLLFKL